MSNFDASTPQLKVVKDMIDAFTFVNPGGLDTLFAKNYRYEPAYGPPALTGLKNENHSGKIERLLAEVSKIDVTYHEVIEAPGKVVIHASALIHTVSGAALPYDTLFIVSFVEEDGELKILSMKDFHNPQQRKAFVAGAAKVAAEGGSAS